MRKFIAILMIFILCFGFAGCDKVNKKPSEINLKSREFDLYDFAIYDTKTEHQIYLGMSKKEVDKLLEESIQDKSVKNKYSYSGFCVIYRDNKIVSMSLSTKDLSTYDRFITNRNVFLGINKKDAVDMYGVDWESEKSGTYIILRKDKQFILLENLQVNDYEKYDTSNIFFISFLSDDKGNINYISISDYNYGMFFK